VAVAMGANGNNSISALAPFALLDRDFHFAASFCLFPPALAWSG
jgi:hypothetical protein